MSQRRFIAVWSFVLLLSLIILFTLLVSHPLSAQDSPAKLKPVRTFKADAQEAIAVSLSRDDALLASGYANADVRIWDPSTGEKLRVLSPDRGALNDLWSLMAGQPPPTSSLQFAPKPPWGPPVLAVGYQDGVRLWNAQSGEMLVHLPKSEDHHVDDLAFSPEGVFLAASSLEGVVSIWNTRSQKLVRRFKAHGPADTEGNQHPDNSITNAVAFSPGPAGQYLATGAEDGLIRIWNWKKAQENQGGLTDTEAFHVATLRAHKKADAHFNDVRSMRFVGESADTLHLLSVSWDETLRRWSIPDGTLLETFRFEGGSLNAIDLSPDASRFAMVRGDTLEIRSVSDGSLLAAAREHRDWIVSLDWSSSGRWIVTGSGSVNPRGARDDRVILWKNPFYEAGESSDGDASPEE